MENKELRVIFMGTPEFATESLKYLVENDYNVVGVVTAPDKPAGRGKKVMSPDVKNYAESVNLPVLQPEKLKKTDFIQDLKALTPDVIVVVAFRMLPRLVWEIPAYGTFNLHASLLPQYRGAAPINWAIINGETKTGLTTFFIDEKIDTGKIIQSVEEPIDINDNAGTLHDRLMHKGAKLVANTIDIIANGEVELTDQKHVEVSFIKPAPKIFKQDCLIDWKKPGEEIYNFIRGLSPYPGAITNFKYGDESFQVKIYYARFRSEKHNHAFGQILKDDGVLAISVSNGFIDLLEIQRSGKKRMKAGDFLNGIRDFELLSLIKDS